MQSDEDLSVIESVEQFDDPLDRLESLDAKVAPPDPEEMLAKLSDEDPSQRMLAARSFCELQDSRSINPLIKLLDDICPLVRVSAAYALGRNTSPEAVAALIGLLARDWNGYVRKGIVWALGNGSDRSSVQPLIHALRTDISAVRLWAASSLAQIAKLEYEDAIVAIAPLIEGLRRDSVAAVRGNCAWAIGQLCRELPSNVVYATAIDALIESLVEDEDYSVKEDAKSALLRVGDPRGMQMIEDLELEGLI
ncbi:MAG: HEAT repeat domain-containing protein [Crocosphaera sp.]|nr:HEAT repeat domain-containing protein [Crocosphaera sp.]